MIKIYPIIIFTILIGIVLSAVVYSNYKNEMSENSDMKYENFISVYFLPITIIVVFIVNTIFHGLEVSIMNMMYFFVNLSVYISIYYLILIILLKWLRKMIQPFVISLLWTVPNCLYWFVMYNNYTLIDNPLVLPMNKTFVYLCMFVWMIIFILILVWKIVEHKTYKKQILDHSIEITDENTLNIFELEKSYVGFEKTKLKEKKIKVMKSKQISSPLTIGIRDEYLILPNKNYTDEELHLIFRHELIHICKQDSLTKFFLIFCAALCWFNPLMWFANKKCSEDLELSCDCSVLRQEDEQTRKKYAKLILSNTNSEKGFTTCLSANALSLQYRLNNVIKPKKRYIGGFLVGIAICLLSISFGKIGLAIDGYHGKEEFFQSNEFEKIELISVYPNDNYNEVTNCLNEKEIINYLSNLELYKLTYEYDPDDLNYLSFNYKVNDLSIYIRLYETNVIEIKKEDSNDSQYYYVDEGIDFNYINQYLEKYPSLTVSFLLDNISFNDKANIPLTQLIKDNELVYEKEVNHGYNNGRWTNFNPTQIIFDFSNEKISEYEIIIESIDGIKTISSKEIQDNKIDISKIDSFYTIHATYIENDVICEATYQFKMTFTEQGI